jgi:hypothetical protein
MEDYEMKNGTATITYNVGDAEQVVNPTEDNDLVQIGYKPELEVLRYIYYYTEETYLQSLREDSAYGLWLASLAQSWSFPPQVFLINATFS